MAWECPTCGREFRNRNQWHSCERREVAQHLEGKSALVIASYQQLHDTAAKLEGVTVSPSKTSVQFRTSANFLSLRLKRDYIEMEFQLSREDADFPITICKRVSSNRVWHRAFIEDPTDIDERVLGWIHESFELITGAS